MSIGIATKSQAIAITIKTVKSCNNSSLYTIEESMALVKSRNHQIPCNIKVKHKMIITNNNITRCWSLECRYSKIVKTKADILKTNNIDDAIVHVTGDHLPPILLINEHISSAKRITTNTIVIKENNINFTFSFRTCFFWPNINLLYYCLSKFEDCLQRINVRLYL